jgi:CubicO group peptidase (beta-lactamase class C family)
MVPGGAPGYGARCMAATQLRRAGARRAILILAVAVATAIATVTLGPILSGQRAVDLTGAATATSSPRPSSIASPSATALVVAPTATADATTGPTSTPGPTPSAAPSASPSPGAAPVATPPVLAPPPIPADLHLTYRTQLALQSRLDRLRERYGIPGISVAIVMPDGSTWVGVSGLADVAAGRPVTPSTSFAVASISKTFTSALILSLAEEGRIDLDAPVRTYLPNLKKVGSRVLIRQLLDHTSGLRDYFFHASIDRALLSNTDRRWDATDALRYVGKAYFKPGAGWHYSNTNYLVLGLLAEAVGREPLGEQVRARFLRPLRLDRTWYQPGEALEGDVAHGYRFDSPAHDAKAIDLSAGSQIVPFTSVITAAAGAGGYASDARDLARWARALYGGRLLAPETVARMIDVTATANYKARVPYGLGVQLIDIDGRRTLGHSGRLLGFRSAVRYLPDGGVSIAVLTNQSRIDPGPILRSLLRVALTPDPMPCRCFDRP